MKKADFIIIGVVVLLVGVLLFFLYGVGDRQGSYVQIEVDGAVAEVLPLDTDTEKKIITDGGENTLVIKNGYAKITQADCPDGVCKNHSKISRNGESIICLPHKLVISIVSSNPDDEIDLAAQ